MNVLKRITKTAVNLCHIYVTLHDAENKRCAESLTRWWPGTESNCRHKDFQSSALPTELPGLYRFPKKKDAY